MHGQFKYAINDFPSVEEVYRYMCGWLCYQLVTDYRCGPGGEKQGRKLADTFGGRGQECCQQKKVSTVPVCVIVLVDVQVVIVPAWKSVFSLSVFRCFCEVYINDSPAAKTTAKQNDNILFWGEQFELK